MLTKEDTLEQDLLRLWELGKLPDAPQLTPMDEAAVSHFHDTIQTTEDGRYSVCLSRPDNSPSLGESRNMAAKRFLQNEKSLTRKDKLREFNIALTEYLTLDHAEKVPTSDLQTKPNYYLPIHGVFKDTSTTTKVRPVFDASAKSSNGVSLNDTLLTGPSLNPLLTDVIIQFRQHKIGFSANISKMFREILLHESERDLHRFLLRDETGYIRDHRMKRLTFGVKSSPIK